MNENIDLAKILNGCPEGTEFYCSIYGVVKFVRISATNWIIISTKIGNKCISKMGRFDEELFSDDECIFFPSKDQRDWSRFERFWDKKLLDKPVVEKFDINTLHPFDRVLVRDFLNEDWMADFFERIDENDVHYNVTCVTSHWEQCIPYNDETKHLLGTREDCPEYYKWWERKHGTI